MKTALKITLAICILGSLFIFIRATDMQGAIHSIRMIGYRCVLLLVITFAAYWCGTLSWKYCMGNTSHHISTGKLFLIRHIGETVSLINPASIIIGETVKIHLLQKLQIQKNTAIASILISRTLLIITQLILFTAAALILTIGFTAGTEERRIALPASTVHQAGANDETTAVIGYVLLFFIALFIPLLLYRRWWKSVLLQYKFGRLLQSYTSGWRLKLKEVSCEISYLIKHQRTMILLAVFFAFLHWILGSLEFFFILKFLGIKVTVIKALLVDMGVIFFKSAGAFIPGQIGIEEYGNKIMLAAIGIPGASIWITASILRRARQLIWIIFGIAVYWIVVKRPELK
jgi:uncharacterized membrane protein YbhN (UPF0104 family)